MGRFFLVAALFLLLGYHSSAFAQVFYAYPDAPVIEKSKMAAGSYFGIGDNELVRLSGYGRWGLTSYLDIGAEVLVEHAMSDWRGGAGTDIKFALFPRSSSLPFDLSANTGVGFASGGGVTIIQAPLAGIVSTAYEMDNGSLLVPYLGV